MKIKCPGTASVRSDQPPPHRGPVSAALAALSALGFLSLCLLLAPGCARPPQVSEGVQLLSGGDEISPTSTLEVRFDEPMAAPGDVGREIDPSPVKVEPALRTTFRWLSARSGSITFREPPALGLSYTFSLRRGLRTADGNPARAKLRHTLPTPPLRVIATATAYTGFAGTPDGQNRMRLDFNAPVSARAARGKILFQDTAGTTIEAKVAQVTDEMLTNRFMIYGWQYPRPLASWDEQFSEPPPKPQGELPPGAAALATADQNGVYHNSLDIQCPQQLPPGTGWRLVVLRGLKADGVRTRLAADYSMDLGSIRPMEVSSFKAHNSIRTGKRVTLGFTHAPIAESAATNFLQWLDISPKVEDLRVENAYYSGLEIHGSFALAQPYNITIKAGLPASDGYALPVDFTNTVSFSPVPPRLYFPAFRSDQLAAGNRTLPLLAVNVGSIHVRAKVLDENTLLHGLRGYGKYVPDWDPQADEGAPSYKPLDYDVVPGRTVFQDVFETVHLVDQPETVELYWDQILAGTHAAAVFIEAVAVNDPVPGVRRPGTQALIQLTDLGLVWKSWKGGGAVFAFSYESGEALKGVTARLRTDEDEPLSEAQLDGRSLSPIEATRAGSWLVARNASDLRAIPWEANEHSPRREHFRRDWDPTTNRLTAALFSDRLLYRPGETVHFKGLLRLRTDQGLGFPTVTTANLVCQDPKSVTIWRTNTPISDLGSFDADIPLAPGSVGQHSVVVTILDGTFEHSFDIEEFRPNPFEVKLQTKSVYQTGEEPRVELSAKYLLGKPLTRAKASWTASVMTTPFAPRDFGGFEFGSHIWERSLAPELPNPGAQAGNGVYTGGTNLVLGLQLPKDLSEFQEPLVATMNVEVRDLDQQTVSRQTSFTLHTQPYYLGVKVDSPFLTEGARIPLTVAAVAATGVPWSNSVPVTATLTRIEWKQVRVEIAGGFAGFDREAERHVVSTQRFDSATLELREGEWSATTNTPLPELVLDRPGDYLLEITDSTNGTPGRTTSISLRAGGEGEATWEREDTVRFKLDPDKDSYEPGETAHILAQLPFPGTALISIERESVLRSYVTNLTGNAPVIEVPLMPEDAPGVFVSVFLLRGMRNDPAPTQEPAHRVSTCEVKVERPDSQLAVKVSASAPSYRPGAPVELEVAVSDENEKPVQGAEVTLYAVDEGVLMLTEEGVPDPHSVFYAPPVLGVTTHSTFLELLPESDGEKNFSNKGFLVGGGGRTAARENFAACAFWQPNLLTDASGKVKATFPAPDSLTKYRIVAVAHARTFAFGNASGSFEVNKPLLIDPATPAFARTGDHLFLRAVAHNLTDQPLETEVRLDFDKHFRATEPGLDTRTNLTRALHLAPGESAEVSFSLTAAETGPAPLRWEVKTTPQTNANVNANTNAAESVTFADAAIATVRVEHSVPVLREVIFARITNATTPQNLLANANPALFNQDARVEIQLSNRRILEAAEAMDQLLHYPYGCVEQTSSSLLPWLVVKGAPHWRSMLNRGDREIQNSIRAGVSRLFGMQTWSGGLSYWPGGSSADAWGSAYAGVVLAIARQRGVELPDAGTTNLVNYLRGQLRGSALEQAREDLESKCLAAFALALWGRPETAYHEVLAGRIADLPAQARLWLAMAMLESGARADSVKNLMAPPGPGNPAPQSAHAFGSSTTILAARLAATLRARPGSPEVDRLLAELVGDRAGIRWQTTQENAWSLWAIDTYDSQFRSPMEDLSGSLQGGGTNQAFALNRETSSMRLEFSGLSQGRDAALTATTTPGAMVFARITLTAPAKSGVLEPRLERGLGLDRRYTLLNETNGPAQDRTWTVGDRVLVTLNLRLPTAARFIAVDDPLPALLEPIHTKFRSQAGAPTDVQPWMGDHQELRADRALFFADSLEAGVYRVQYLARVRVAGTATAPSAKAEAMYDPSRLALSGAVRTTAQP